MIPRHLSASLELALADTPAVFLGGPRQVGKSTLAQVLCSGQRSRRYITFDDVSTLAVAAGDPAGFVAGLEGDVVLDEVQRAPGVLLPLKAAIDRDRRPGRFLLTGSAAPLVQPAAIADALAGRVEILTLWPFSQGEVRGTREQFIDAVFAPGFDDSGLRSIGRLEVVEAVAAGGFPEVRERPDASRRDAWFRSYVSTLVQRDIRDIATIERFAEIPRLLRLVLERTGGLANAADLSRSAAIPQSTVKRYLALLEGVFLVRSLRPWSGNRTSRLVKAPKFYPVDSGLGAHVLDHDAESLTAAPDRFGPLLEAFVIGEVIKQSGWSRTVVTPFFFRNHAGDEVDLVLEDRRGRCVAIEIKGSSTIGPGDARGIERFADLAGRRFHAGFVLYLGREIVPFSDRVKALPIAALWTLAPRGDHP